MAFIKAKNAQNITVRNNTATNMESMVIAENVSDMLIEGNTGYNVQKILEGGNLNNVEIANNKIHARVPQDLIDSILRDAESSNLKDIKDKYGERLKSYGIFLDRMNATVNLALKGKELIKIVYSWFQ
jgi:hypothetical protein